MSLDAYISELEGEASGKIEGSCTQKGREGWILIRGCSHNVVAPRDAASGLPTGKRVHRPVRFTQELDKATPLIMNLLVNNENIKKVVFRFFSPIVAHDRSKAKGKENQHWTVQLENASVASADFRMANNRIGDNDKLPEMIDFELTYQKIIWTWEDGGVTAEDDWQSPNA